MYKGRVNTIFQKGFDGLVCGITSGNKYSSRNRRLLCLFFTVAAMVLACLRYNIGSWEEFLQMVIWPASGEPKEVLFQRPGFVHVLLGLLLCAPLCLRGLLPFDWRSPYYYLTLIFNVGFFAAMAQLVTGLAFSFAYNLTNTIIIAALLLAWMGVRSVAGFAWIPVFGVAAYHLAKADAPWSDFGIWFLACGFLSLLLQSDLSPGEMFWSFKKEFRGISRSPRFHGIRPSVNRPVRPGDGQPAPVVGIH